MKQLLNFWREESGATAIEYGLIAAMVGVVIIAGISSTGSATERMYEHITSTITTATNE